MRSGSMPEPGPTLPRIRSATALELTSGSASRAWITFRRRYSEVYLTVLVDALGGLKIINAVDGLDTAVLGRRTVYRHELADAVGHGGPLR